VDTPVWTFIMDVYTSSQKKVARLWSNDEL
jgi:hypothetical protein